jgi:hypothetical protein
VELGGGGWRLTTGATPGSVIYLGGAEPRAAELLSMTNVNSVTVSWQGEGAVVTLVGTHGTRSLKVRTAVVHEPLGRLYEALPLVSFDERARRFWRRVFWLVRIPGGRRLLGLIARRGGGPK